MSDTLEKLEGLAANNGLPRWKIPMRTLGPAHGTPCKGFTRHQFNHSAVGTLHPYKPAQREWMQKHKPLYYTGSLRQDLHHLPLELRSI